MASTYSPNLRLELMATGDQSGTWGDTTNTNLGTLLEQAITGVLSVAQGDVANLTLTALDGAVDEARNSVVNLTGAMTNNRNVVVPTVEKVYLIKNSTTGGFSVTVKTAAGSGVAVAAGTSQWVYCDGTNVVQGLSGTMATQAASAVAITGGTITGLTSLTLASGVASPATNDAAALGSTSLGWSDLFGASGFVWNIANGNWVATHTSGILTVGTGDLRVTTAGTNAASVVTVDGTQTMGNKTLTSPVLNTGVSGTAIADQTAMEAGSSTTLIVVPGRQQFHSSAAKAWVYADTGGTITAGYNVASVDDIGTGQIGVNFTVPMSGVSYGILVSIRGVTTPMTPMVNQNGTINANGADFINYNASSVATDPNNWYCAFFGDQ